MAAVSGGGAAGVGGGGGGASPGAAPDGLGGGPDGLARVERLCQQLYQGTDPASRAEAEATLLPLASSPRFVSECLWILDNSSVRPWRGLVGARWGGRVEWGWCGVCGGKGGARWWGWG